MKTYSSFQITMKLLESEFVTFMFILPLLLIEHQILDCLHLPFVLYHLVDPRRKTNKPI